MNLVTWGPFKELQEVNERLTRIMGRNGGRTVAEDHVKGADWCPTADISETNEEYLIKAELPEVKKDDVKITVEDGILTFCGERKPEKEEKGKKLHRIERYYGTFLRTYTLPAEIDETRVRAEFKDGVLNIHLPKSEKAKTNCIEVKVS